MAVNRSVNLSGQISLDLGHFRLGTGQNLAQLGQFWADLGQLIGRAIFLDRFPWI